MSRLERVFRFVFIWIAAAGAARSLHAEPAIEFNRDIRPILSENCYACHGPDGRKREAGLRLDAEQAAKSQLESGATAIVPGRADRSGLVARIITDNPDERMPPPGTGKQLTPAQIDLMTRWIDSGAGWQGHWSLLPISRPVPPEVSPASPPTTAPDGAPSTFLRNPIDAFVLDLLHKQGIPHAAEADRVTLLRRLSFDLTGLPPKPEEVREFLEDTSEKAYERVVDRLLASPHFGERLAMFWLDLVRYADSVGYHGDQQMSVSPYRDYVLRSFNGNKPFDQFTIEQLAGDLLPNKDSEQQVDHRIASGYNRLGMMSAEGGVQDKEYLAKYIAERVRNVSGTWLGLTLGCCECHDHKFDPFATRDFYRFEAFFADVQERGLYSGSHASGEWGPSIPVPTPDESREGQRLDERLASLQQQLDQPTPELEAAQSAWEAESARAVQWVPLRPERVVSGAGATLTVLDDQSVLASGTSPGGDTYVVTARVPMAGVTAVRIEALPHESLPSQGPGRAGNGNFVLTEFTMAVQPAGDSSSRPVALHNPSATFEQTTAAEKNPYKAWTAASAIDADAQGADFGWAVLGDTGKENHAVFELAQPAAADATGESTVTVTLKQSHGNPQHTLGRFRLAVSRDATPVKAFGVGLPRAVRDLLAVPAAKRNESQRAELARHYRSVAPALELRRKEFAETKSAREALQKKIVTTLVTVAVEPRAVRVLPRGNWMDDSGELVLPGVPASLPQPSATEGRLTRLELARWIVSPENPLTARVLVNRLWKIYFGAGLSRKLEDVGSQGEWPSHPELLDWLAGQLVDSGWDLKATIKRIVMSGTYRQSSEVARELRERDPFNRWLGRQGRFRVDAELVRDNVLAVSGLLVDRVGGRSVFPYQPPGYWSHLNFPAREWQNSSGEDLYRRGLYTHWQRQYLHPSMLAFDAPCREECTTDRVRSNTPLQSLVLLNDPSYVEAARSFAESALSEGGSSTDQRLDFIGRRALSRALSESERRLLTELVERHLAEYRQDPAAASALLAIGQRRPTGRLDSAELAAWTSVTRTVLNLHEFLTRN